MFVHTIVQLVSINKEVWGNYLMTTWRYLSYNLVTTSERPSALSYYRICHTTFTVKPKSNKSSTPTSRQHLFQLQAQDFADLDHNRVPAVISKTEIHGFPWAKEQYCKAQRGKMWRVIKKSPESWNFLWRTIWIFSGTNLALPINPGASLSARHRNHFGDVALDVGYVVAGPVSWNIPWGMDQVWDILWCWTIPCAVPDFEQKAPSGFAVRAGVWGPRPIAPPCVFCLFCAVSPIFCVWLVKLISAFPFLRKQGFAQFKPMISFETGVKLTKLLFVATFLPTYVVRHSQLCVLFQHSTKQDATSRPAPIGELAVHSRAA